ncbi:calcium-binding protein [Paracoccus litorisediminis]|uniref:Calcium-binding protein n=1 Tax=Paracoccus litorisediminis TaxID=2006130 RepID=A0A844HIF1_9RHOB|nr:calcium-binding protein [Paracoccus litorisediminis]MTH58778.1 calcium-binding protein [Paracoccus litorisediminis]
MNQTIFLLLGVLGIAGLGSLISSNDDDHPPEAPADDPFGGRELTEGTEDDDTIAAGDGDDAIQSFEGNDSVSGGGGDDAIWTGYGDDTVSADAGDDEIYLGYDDDVYGAVDPGTVAGNDTIDGGEGDDTIITNSGNHSITGGEGDDRIEDHGGTVYIDGEDGDDLILSADASEPDAQDTLLGGDGDDTIHAGANDIVSGGDGDDQIVLRSDAGGATTIIYGSSDSISITLPADYDGEEEYDMVQDGDDVQIVVNGEVLAILKDTVTDDVDNISFTRET